MTLRLLATRRRRQRKTSASLQPDLPEAHMAMGVSYAKGGLVSSGY